MDGERSKAVPFSAGALRQDRPDAGPATAPSLRRKGCHRRPAPPAPSRGRHARHVPARPLLRDRDNRATGSSRRRRASAGAPLALFPQRRYRRQSRRAGPRRETTSGEKSVSSTAAAKGRTVAGLPSGPAHDEEVVRRGRDVQPQSGEFQETAAQALRGGNQVWPLSVDRRPVSTACHPYARTPSAHPPPTLRADHLPGKSLHRRPFGRRFQGRRRPRLSG